MILMIAELAFRMTGRESWDYKVGQNCRDVVPGDDPTVADLFVSQVVDHMFVDPFRHSCCENSVACVEPIACSLTVRISLKFLGGKPFVL